MEYKSSFEDLHIGKIIKDFAFHKNVSSKKIAETLVRYEKNVDKIYKLEDMDVEDVVKISYMLEYNILEAISRKYLSHLPYMDNWVAQESYSIELNMKTERFTIRKNAGNCNFLREIHFGQNLLSLTKENGWSEKVVAKKLHCVQSTISNLFRSKSLKVKKMMWISDVFAHHFIAELYLSRMCIVPSHLFDDCIITLNPQQVCINHLNEATIPMVFLRHECEKEKFNPL